MQDAVQQEMGPDRDLEQGTVLASLAGEAKVIEEGTSSAMPLAPEGPAPDRLGRSHMEAL